MELSARMFWSIIAGLILWTLLLFYAPRVWGDTVIGFAASLFLYMVFDGLRTGSITVGRGGRVSRYECKRNPVGFWFYIGLFLICGGVACVALIYCIFFKRE